MSEMQAERSFIESLTVGTSIGNYKIVGVLSRIFWKEGTQMFSLGRPQYEEFSQQILPRMNKRSTA